MLGRGHVRTIPEMNYEDPSFVIILTSVWIPHSPVLPIYSLLHTTATSGAGPHSKSKSIGPDVTRDSISNLGYVAVEVNHGLV